MAYILGFIFADGNITKVIHNGSSDKLGFGVNKKDIDILRKTKQELSAKQALSPQATTCIFLSLAKLLLII